jgi:Flp pilus assembly pilin Flp
VFRRPIEAVYAAFARAHGLLLTDRGQTLAEYGLIIAAIGVGVMIPAALLFREQLASAFNSATPCLLGSC